MAAFILVHGSGQNARSWARVADALRGHGHLVATPDLPKHAPDWGLRQYAAEIALAAPGPRPVVVGHSASGVFLPLVHEVRECALLVFLAAVVPEPGKSTRDQLAEDPSMFSEAWIDAGPRWFDPAQEESLSRQFMFHDCDEDTLAWALGTGELMDTRHLSAIPCPLSAWPEVPAVSIVATADRTLAPEWGRRISQRVLGRPALEIEAGHCPHVSRPTAVADLLERLALA